MCRLSLLQPRLSAFLASELVVPLPSRRPSIDRLATSTICRNANDYPINERALKPTTHPRSRCRMRRVAVCSRQFDAAILGSATRKTIPDTTSAANVSGSFPPKRDPDDDSPMPDFRGEGRGADELLMVRM
jgi:hypothetical protein